MSFEQANEIIRLQLCLWDACETISNCCSECPYSMFQEAGKILNCEETCNENTKKSECWFKIFTRRNNEN